MVPYDATGGVLAREFESSIVATVSQLTGHAPTIEEAPALITDGVLGHIHIVGGWSGTITAHCSSSMTAYFTECMKLLVIDRPLDRDIAVVETLLESVGNAFMRKFAIKSAVSKPKAAPWSVARQGRMQELKEMWKISCTLAAGNFSFSLAQGAATISLDDLYDP